MTKLSIALVAIMAAVVTLSRAGAQQASIGGAFSLQQAPNKTVRNTDFQGKYLLVFFGYTNCPDVCPTTLNKIAQALRVMRSRATQVQVIFITVDPLRDTPRVMAAYVALFSPAIMGLSGSVGEIAKAELDYHVYVGPRDPKTGAIAHGAILYIMNRDGSFASALPDTVTAPDLAATLLKLTTEP